MNSPNFILPACPLCSSILVVHRPVWHYCSNTSARRKRNCYIFSGCSHAVSDTDFTRIQDDPESWQVTEAAWTHTAGQLFTARTERWTEPQRDRFRRALEEPVPALPNYTPPLNLTDSPESTEQPETESDNG